MAINLTQRSGGTTSSDRPVLPTDTYRMRIMDSKLEDDTFAKPGSDGTLPQKLALTFEITTLTEEQQEAASDAGQDWDDVRIWHRFNPFYGLVREGGPSKLKEFLDNLVEWKLIPELDLEHFAPESLVGVELKCSVVNYKKTMGANKDKPGNKITGFAPIKTKRKNAPEPISVAKTAPAASAEDDGDEPLPF